MAAEMNELLRTMLRYYGVSEAMVLSGCVEGGGLVYRWIRRANACANMSCDAQREKVLRDIRAQRVGPADIS